MSESFPSNLVPDAEHSRELARSIEALPPLKEDYVRMVRLTAPSVAESILAEGLSYGSQGMVTSTVRIWSDATHAEYTTTDPRFTDATAVVLDVPWQEARLHNDATKAPGVVPAKYVVGIIPPGNNT